jgi:hypothetical protein
MTVCDRSSDEPNALVATTLDAGRFWDLIVTALEKLGR